MKEQFISYMKSKGWMPVSEHREIVSIKNQTIAACVHELIEQEKTIDALNGIIARDLTKSESGV